MDFLRGVGKVIGGVFDALGLQSELQPRSSLISTIDKPKKTKSTSENVDTADGEDRTPLFYACQNGNAEMVNYLLDQGAEVNWSDNSNQTPLFIACQNGRTEVVRILLEHEAVVNCTDNDDRTPLFYAIQNDHTAIVNLLIEYGAHVN
jgi:serine/threonine-protein phosphatase 6 regulatory ankyrin repeat subunit B